MKSQSTVKPSLYHYSQGKIFINTNITEIEKDDTIIYEYDTYELPIVDRDNIDEYITENHEALVEFAIKSYKPEPLTDTEKLWTAIEYLLLSGYEVK